jgi:hypothetical protein
MALAEELDALEEEELWTAGEPSKRKLYRAKRACIWDGGGKSDVTLPVALCVLVFDKQGWWPRVQRIRHGGCGPE